MDKDWHAGFLETSDMMFIKSELVRELDIQESSAPEPMKFLIEFLIDYKQMKRDTRHGTLGNPIGANAAIGKKNMNIVITKMAEHILELLKK
ncbi:MAG: creatininase family protein [Nanoarchaeota archaeon]